MFQKIKNLYHLLQALFFATLYEFPAKKMKVIGVTGTDGKTTTVNMIHQVLKEAGKKVSMISSVNAIMGKKVYDTGFHVTTPDPGDVQRYLAQMVKAGSEYAVLEVTSHGLDQNRVFGINFLVGVITNITHEHLDYHKTWENYAKAKAKLLKNVSFSIINADDKSYKFLRPCAAGKIITYGIKKKADFTPKNFPLKLKIAGDYNIYNALAAVSACYALGIEKQVIKKALENFKNMIGRMEEIDESQDFAVVVDFAHTPNALEQALKTLRSQFAVSAKGGPASRGHNSQLIAVFGSAGLRDIDKRWMMGEVSGKLADLTIVTAEDPRTEDPDDIAKQIAEGCKRTRAREFTVHSTQYPAPSYVIVPDRREAIKYAVALAKKGDVVGIFGKGHERSMCYGKTEYPWSDQDEVRKALKEKLKKV